MAVLSTELVYTGIVFVGTFTLAYILMERKRIKSKEQNYPPSLPSFPLIGSLLFLPKFDDLHIFFMTKSKTLGSVFSLQFPNQYCVVLNGREVIHEALIKHSLDFASRPTFPSHKILNLKMSGIIEHEYNPDFRRYHQLCLNIFKEFGFGDCVMETRINQEVDELVQIMSTLKGKAVHPEAQITRCVLNVIASITFGARYGLDDTEADEIINITQLFLRDSVETNTADFFPFLKYLPSTRRNMERCINILGKFLAVLDDKILKSQMGEGEESFIKRFIEEEGPDFDREQLLFLLRDFVMAGTETSSTTLQWALVMLANNQEIQKRLQAEIDSVVSRDRLPSLSDRPSLPYVEAAILELMRWKTTVPLSLPHETLCDTTVGGYSIPSGAMVFVNLYSAHMDPTVWSEPEVYRPERFLDVAGYVTNKEQMIAFSLGRRSCLGELLARQEVFLFFTGLLQKFHISPPEGTDRLVVHDVVGTTLSPSFYEVRLVLREK